MNKHSILCTVTLLVPLLVVGSESANYSITPQSETSGGLSASQNYTLNSAADAAGAVASAAYSVRGGFAGSLFDPAQIEILPPLAEVNEGATLQLSARLVMDDQSTAPLPPAQVNWLTLGGPVMVNSAGLATGMPVFQDTAAVVQATSGVLGLSHGITVRNILTDNFSGYAGDGMDDAWQVLYFGESSANAAPLLDPDNDGWTNLFEYNAGLVPTDPLSVFSVRMEPVPGQPAQRRIIFSPRLAGRTYTVLGSTTMLPASWSPVPGATFSDNGSQRTVTDPNAGGARKFYKVDVQKP